MTADDATFSEFVAARGHELTRFAALICADRHEAEDLVQDALVSAYTRWRQVERMDSPEAYVRRIMVNRNISIWRRHRNRVDLMADPPEAASLDSAESSAVHDEIVRLIRALPPRQRAAVALRFYADYTHDEIGDVLGCSASTVRSQISRALTTLRGVIPAADVQTSGKATP
jgi:RNA polymerase sigma-70 factor (sigma-E family)